MWPSSCAMHRAQLVDRVELGQEAGVDEDVLAAGDEGVRLAVLDDVDRDAARRLTPAARNSGNAIRSSVCSISASRISVSAAAGPARRRSASASATASRRVRVRKRRAPSVARAGVSWLMAAGGRSLGERGVRTSSRGEVDPFIVMDVMEAARAEEARGRSVIHMEVGQPGTPAPAAARGGAGARDGGGAARLHGGARAAGAPGADRAALPRLVRGRARSGPRRGDGRLVGGVHPRLHQPLRARRQGGDRRSRLSELSQHPARARPRAGRHRRRGPEDRFQPVPRDLGDGPRRGAGREPGQPDRHDARPLRARGADRAGGGARHRLRLGRDLPRHPVRRRARSRRSRSPTRSTSSTRSRSTSR